MPAMTEVATAAMAVTPVAVTVAMAAVATAGVEAAVAEVAAVAAGTRYQDNLTCCSSPILS
jgi:hypothetical protein